MLTSTPTLINVTYMYLDDEVDNEIEIVII